MSSPCLLLLAQVRITIRRIRKTIIIIIRLGKKKPLAASVLSLNVEDGIISLTIESLSSNDGCGRKKNHLKISV